MFRQLDEPSPNSARNVHIYNHEGHILGGVWQNGAITNAHLYEMCNIFLNASEPYSLFRLNADGSTNGRIGTKNRSALQPGSYIVLSNNGNPISVETTEEAPARRVITKGSTEKLTLRKKKFQERVRSRDDHCMISGLPNLRGNDFSLFDAAHIYPYAREQAWVNQNLSRWITDNSPEEHQGITKIHSVQNGLLISHNVHTWFDSYKVTVNVADDYRIICLAEDPMNLDGRTLDPRCRNLQDPDRVSDQLLRWHHRQAVLSHMKDAGEKSWETEFEDGTDMMGEILAGPDSRERMEAEMFTRLGAGEIHYPTSPEVSSP
ncbi:hypothetical protein VE02_09838 [Pseudogymnoascus sp. 03VT05]|nr:hypothetical protein VE02_09838 [Pseudogymnoascus sp. 03VT05]